ncbi:hypothetical protein KC727_00690 [Candidatus Kaiserbacteria bacterium]|nr:hypothetical protein [Candidatus Kaiserbacteria bacterium]
MGRRLVNNLHTHQIVRIFLILVFVCSAIWYFLFQARIFMDGPEITLINEPDTLQHSQTVTLEGVAQNIVSLTLNGNTLSTDEEGRFSRALILPEGYTVVTLTAKDRYGRYTSLEREFVYSPAKAL